MNLLEYGEKLKAENPKNLSNEQLCERLEQMEKLMAGCISWGSPLTSMDFCGENFLLAGLEEMLADAIKEAHLNIKPQEALNLLSMPTRGTYLRKEKIDRLRLAQKIMEDKKLIALFEQPAEEIEKQLPSANHGIDAVLNEHVRNYEWLNYGYQGPALPKSFFIMEIKQDVQQGGLDEKYKQLENEEKNREAQVRELLSKLNLDPLTKKRLRVSREFGYSKNLRKEISFFAIHAIERIQKEISKRLSLTLRQVRYFLPEELRQALVGGNALSADFANERQRFCIYIYDHGNRRVLVGQEAERLQKILKRPEVENVSELIGQCACPGQAQGIVRIVMSAEDGKKMQAGDVLVSFSTNPNMIPVMKIASAIVTDVGGVTCHAAIVSRELKIPCVIGTKIATKALKDGELVEVNATEGIVKKVSS